MYAFLRSILAATMLVGVSAAGAVTVSFAGDQAGFLASSGATSIGELTAGSNWHTVGAVTFFDGSPLGDLVIGKFSNEFGGALSVGLSGPENFSMTIAGGAYSFGFGVHEPGYIGPTGEFLRGCISACVDTSFEFEIFAGTTSLGLFTYNAPDDNDDSVGGPVGFFGVHSSVLFDRVVVRDVTGNADNEFFGAFVLGNTPYSETPAAVPEPPGAVLALEALALAALTPALRRPRKRKLRPG